MPSVDLLYSLTLLFSLIAGSIAILQILLKAFGKSSGRMSLGLAITSLCFLMVSIVVHKIYGHGSGSIEPMDGMLLLKKHPSFVVAGLIAAAAIVMRFLLYPDTQENRET